MSAAAASASSDAPDVITLTSLAIDPSTPVPIDAALKLTFAFDSTQEMSDAFWDFKYVVDSASKRHVIEVRQHATYACAASCHGCPDSEL
jgi:hypothetical protein